ncbi:MAG: hydrogenase small subunit [Phycisphaerae bacterium]|nr:hydrogenase small subunit [Phycisphaerae bacterium]
MLITRRSFLKYCAAASAALGLDHSALRAVEQAAGGPDGPSVLWLQGSGCSGCSISFLNYISPNDPKDAADVLIRSVSLDYHPTLSAGAGQMVVDQVKKADNFILLVEGGVPTAFGGHACVPWSDGDKEITFEQAVRELASKARQVVCVGTCASYGGINAIGENPAGVKAVGVITGGNTVNVPGCPPHPNWIVSTLVSVLQGKTIPVDDRGRPTSIYGRRIHDECPFEDRGKARSFGVNGRCMEELGCQGPGTGAPCARMKWNNGINWCVQAGSICLGCTEPSFPNPVERRRGRGGGRGRGPRM